MDAHDLLQAKADGDRPARVARARSHRALEPRALPDLDGDDLLSLVREGLEAVRAAEAAGAPAGEPVEGSLLDVATELVRRRYASCDVCFRDCRVDRFEGPEGLCRLGEEGRVVREYLHYGEEEELIPAHAVYLAGCDLRCTFCSERAFVDEPVRGEPVPPARLARQVERRRAEGARTLDLVGGSPDVSLLYLLRVLGEADRVPPVAWNSDMGARPWALDVIALVADAWVADLKFGNDRCGARLAGILDYGDVVRPNVVRAAREGYLVVRHLVMPGHLECCTRPVLEWLAAEVPGARVNVMDQYCPTDRTAGREDLGRMATREEVAGARDRARDLGLRTRPPGVPRPG